MSSSLNAASTSDLKDTLKGLLEKKGLLKDVKSRIRAEVFHALEDRAPLGNRAGEAPADLHIASELVREFLVNMRFNNTLSVFNEEAGHRDSYHVDRQLLAGECGVNIIGDDEDANQVPLLVLLVSYLKQVRDKYETELYDSMLVEKDGNDSS